MPVLPEPRVASRLLLILIWTVTITLTALNLHRIKLLLSRLRRHETAPGWELEPESQLQSHSYVIPKSVELSRLLSISD